MSWNSFLIKSLLTISVLSLIAGCSSKPLTEDLLLEKAPLYEEPILVQKQYDGFSVSNEMLSNYLRLFHKEKRVKRIEPIIVEGDTIAFGVNYANDSGWSLISADIRMEPLLASSEEGSLSLSGVDNYAMVSLFELLNQVKKIKEVSDTRPNSTWAFLLPNAKRQVCVKTKASRGLTVGMWIAVDTTIRQVSQSSSKLTSTQWHQHSPWNRYTPKINDTNCVVGCGPIAIGQLICKYIASNPGTHTIPSSMTYYFNDWFTSFSNYTTTAWTYLVENDQPIINDNDSTALFLSWIGCPSNMDAEYGLTETTTEWNDHERVLNNYLNYRNGFNVGDNNTIQKNQFCDTLISSIFSGSPVLIASKDHYGYKPHSFIIDKCTINETQYVISYVFDPNHYVTDDEYYSLPSWMFEWPSMGEFPDYDPEKNTAEKEIYSVLSNNVIVQMNWGFKKDSNNTNFNNINYLLRNRSFSYYDGIPSMSEYIFLSWVFNGNTIGDVYHWAHHFSRKN